MRYKITLNYDGGAFNGWQIQPNAPTVQQTLERSLSILLGSETHLTGAGRTDTGVNAIGYVAHFDVAAELDPARLTYKLNAILPSSIVVKEVASVPDDFHARFGATQREYTYFLHQVKDPFVQRYSYLYTYPLDFEAMNCAAHSMIGRHDFHCFEKTGADNRTSICTVFEAHWESYTPSHLQIMGSTGEAMADYYYFRISADRFLRNMVRATVGTLLEVGRGRRSEADFEALIGGEGLTRCSAGESVPGHALFLSDILY